MNSFDLDIEQLDSSEVKDILSDNTIDKLPNVPPFLSKEECAAVLGVSMKIINQLVESGDLPVTGIPGDSSPCTDLFGEPIEPQCEICILRSDLIGFLERNLLCNKPVLNAG